MDNTKEVFDKNGIMRFKGTLYGETFKTGYGSGKFYTENGELLYDGEFEKGKFNGIGKRYYDNGTRFEGNFESGYPHGTGKLFGINNNTYFFDDLQTKEKYDIKVNYQDVLVYEGNWENGKRTGKGISLYYVFGINFSTLVLFNWISYDGDWLNDYKEGFGILKRQDQANVFFDFDTNELVEYISEPSWYIGEWKNDLPHGKGKLFINNKLFYDGQMLEGDFYGFCKIYDDEGNLRFEGEAMGTPLGVCYQHYQMEEKDENLIVENMIYQDFKIPVWLIDINQCKKIKLGSGKYFTKGGEVWFKGAINKG